MRHSTRAVVDPFIVMDVMERARLAEAAGRRVIHMEVGQPDTPAPRGAREALARAMAENALGYTVALGLPALRARIARLYRDRHGLEIDPARVVVTAGASGAFVLAFTALFEAGDRVAMGDPGYSSYRQILRALSLRDVGIPTRTENRLQPVPEELPDGIAGLIVASPANPTGTTLDREGLRALIEAAAERGAAFISDEIYHGIEYDRPAVSALESWSGSRAIWAAMARATVRRFRTLRARLAAAAILLAALAPPAPATELAASARLLPGAALEETDGLVTLQLALSQPVPWRIELLADPPRLALDFREVTFGKLPAVPVGPVTAVRAGQIAAGWSRLVLDLAGPVRIVAAGMATEPGPEARLRVSFAPDREAVAETGEPADQPAASADDGRLHVTLDPGHGGLDPGAEAGGMVEADEMLTFARDLREELLRDGRFEVSLTRAEDVFVPLETRITLARQAGADVFLSLHADALPDAAGAAAGVTVYTLSADAGDLASQRLAERHERSDLLPGVDLGGQGDAIAVVLMDLARHDTAPRAEALADRIVAAIGEGAGPLNSRPRREAGFSVLKSPGIPSVLIELGFLSSEADRARITDPDWRRQTAQAIAEGLAAWAAEDAFRATLMRR